MAVKFNAKGYMKVNFEQELVGKSQVVNYQESQLHNPITVRGNLIVL